MRECPAKAIRILEGQAQIISERCIGCGNCVRVCSQGAKQIVNTIYQAQALLDSDHPVSALVAPSFAAEFGEDLARHVVAAIRMLGFNHVFEVGFGADLVAHRYQQLLLQDTGRRCIATSCPAIVLYVEKHHPSLVSSLAPVVSPMIAMARVVRKIHGGAMRTVFIGPCTSKKFEGVDEDVCGEINAVLTFRELRQMFDGAGIVLEKTEPCDFEPPHAGLGALFALCSGLLQAAGINEDLVTGDVVTAAGRRGFLEAMKEFESGDLDARLLESLACDGCIMGAGMSVDLPAFRRRSRVSRYVQRRRRELNLQQWQASMEWFGTLDLTRNYRSRRVPVTPPDPERVREVLRRMGKEGPEDLLDCGACGYETCHAHAVAICEGLAESEMCLPYTIDRLEQAVNDLAQSNEQLLTTRDALMQSEKLASMGQLAAGIAHEVNNPLGVVLMYAHLLKDSFEKDSPAWRDSVMIAEQADRCKRIVAGLLNFARQNKVLRQPVDVRHLIGQSIKLVPVPDSVKVATEVEMPDCIIDVDGDQIVQVISNLVSNAVAAMPNGGELKIGASGDDSHIRITVEDTGIGISEQNAKKVFEPFFTTKQMGRGTGLGLAVAYGIVKMHRGSITLESNAKPEAGPTGTIFTVTLPRSVAQTEETI